MAASDTENLAEREIVITRTVDAPRELVWRVWTEPTHIAQWWGPNGFTNTIHEMSVKVGGVWRFIMHGPDGTDYPNRIVYREIVEPERLVYDHSADDAEQSNRFRANVAFVEEGAKTTVTLRLVFKTKAARDATVKFGAVEGGKQTLARLDHYASALRPDDGAFSLTREFDAPRDLVWRAWSEPERLKEWWGPEGCAIEVARLEFRPGGFFHYAMRYPGQPPMWGRFIYRKIAPPLAISWLNSFSNEGCGITRAPFDIVWPLELLNTVTLAEQDGRTTLRLRAFPHGETAEERKTFLGFFASLNQGFGGTMDQLAAYLARR